MKMNFLRFYPKISTFKINSCRINCINSLQCRNFSKINLDVNTNLSKDVIMYKFKNDKFFKFINIFGICQFVFWSYLTVNAVSTLRNIPKENTTNETVWWKRINLGENKYRYGIIISTFAIGFGILSITWIYTLHSVKYLILRKGGKDLTIVTFAPFGENRLITLGLQNICAKEARTAGRSYIPLKVRGHYFHYMIDTKGEFTNPQLYDNTAGLKRVWNK